MNLTFEGRSRVSNGDLFRSLSGGPPVILQRTAYQPDGSIQYESTPVVLTAVEPHRTGIDYKLPPTALQRRATLQSDMVDLVMFRRMREDGTLSDNEESHFTGQYEFTLGHETHVVNFDILDEFGKPLVTVSQSREPGKPTTRPEQGFQFLTLPQFLAQADKARTSLEATLVKLRSAVQQASDQLSQLRS
jgi:hypothetical protein